MAETTIATNPFNPKNLVAGTNDYRIFNPRENRNDGSGWAYTTFDGGKTWLNVQLPHLTFQIQNGKQVLVLIRPEGPGLVGPSAFAGSIPPRKPAQNSANCV